MSTRRGLALAAALALGACSRAPAPALLPAAQPAVAAPTFSYADERAAAEATVAEARAAIAHGPVVWPQWDTVARAELALAQLTADYALYTAAGQSLDKAFALAGQGGPYLSRARYNVTVHRLDRVEADLRLANSGSDPDVVGIQALRADLAFYRGHYDEALAGYRAVLERREDVPSLTRLALWHGHMGHLSEALALLDRADAIYHGDSPHPRAWLALQRGLLYLDRGRWDLALAHYQHALRLLPGWWLAREHVAEIHALQGEADTARAEYAEIIHETENPEFMDAMARLLRERGDAPGADGWIQRARALYETRLAALPEATYGHGLDHFLQFGTPAEALALARKNHTLRPNGDAQIQLIDALLHAGLANEAERLTRTALASGWRSAKLHAAAARAFAAAGRISEAAAQVALAKALNPRSAQQYGLP